MSHESKFVVPVEPGDPVCSLFISSDSIVTGSYLGTIVHYDIPRNSRRILCGFSDDAVRGVFMHEGTVYGTVGDLHCKHIRIRDPYDQLEMKFNRRSTASGFKYVIQKFGQVTVFYPGMTIFIDVISNMQTMCPFKLQQAMVMNVCPVDSYQYQLLFTEFPVSDTIPPPPRKFKFVDVSTGEVRFELNDPNITHARFVNERAVVYFSRNKFVVFDLSSKKQTSRFDNFHRSDIVAIDCSLCMGESPFPFVVSVGVDGSVIIWNYESGKVVGKGQLRNPCFSLGYAYCVQCFPNISMFQVALSDDYGVHYLEIRKDPLVAPV
jgi:WD40 repeat protein